MTKCILSKTGIDGHKTNLVSRSCWLTAKWLRTMATSKKVHARSSTLLKFNHYEHQLEINVPELQQARSKFEEWDG